MGQSKADYFNSVYKEDIILEFQFQKLYLPGGIVDSNHRINKLIESGNLINNKFNSKGLSKEEFFSIYDAYGLDKNIWKKIN